MSDTASYRHRTLTITVTEVVSDEEAFANGAAGNGLLGGNIVASKTFPVLGSATLSHLILNYLAERVEETALLEEDLRAERDFTAFTVITRGNHTLKRQLDHSATLSSLARNDLLPDEQIFIEYKKPTRGSAVTSVMHKMVEFSRVHCLAWSLVSFSAIVLCIFLGRAIWFMTHNNRVGWDNFGIVIDAGSVHSSVSVYQWPFDQPSELKEVFQCEFDDMRGVTSFIKEPAKVKNYIRNSQCLRDSVEVAQFARSSRIYLGCTGGMRSVNRTNPIGAKQLLGNITVALQNTGIMLGKVEVLDGLDEGVYGWVTVNVKSSAEKVGSLDWGGASAQITFPLIPGGEESNTSLAAITDHVKTVQVFNKKNKVYSNSQLCYGQSSALKRYLVQLIHEVFANTNSTIVDFAYASPCHPRDMGSFQITGAVLKSTCTMLKDEKFNEALGLASNRTFTFVGSGDLSRCRKMVQDQFDTSKCKSVYQQHRTCFNFKKFAQPPHGLKYYAFSTYYYLVQVLKVPYSLAYKLDSIPLNISELEEILTRVCVTATATLSEMDAAWGSEMSHNSCFRAVFMQRLLTGAYGFTNWTNIEFVSKVGGTSVGWKLGYILSRLDGDYEEEGGEGADDSRLGHQSHKPVSTTTEVLMVLTVLFIIFNIMMCCFIGPIIVHQLYKAYKAVRDFFWSFCCGNVSNYAGYAEI